MRQHTLFTLFVLALCIAILFVACAPTDVVIVTATPAPATNTPVQPTAVPTDTPSAQCPTSNPSAHCHHYFKPINANPFFDPPYLLWSPEDSYFGVPGSPEVIKPTIEQPAPFGLFTWDFKGLVGNHQGLVITGWRPNVFCKDNVGCDINRSGTSGRSGAEIYGALQEGILYLAVFRYIPEGVRLYNPNFSYAATKGNWIEDCKLTTNRGFTKYGAPQTLDDRRQSYSDNYVEEILVTIYAEDWSEVIVNCGVTLVHPAWDGQIRAIYFGMFPVPWNHEEGWTPDKADFIVP